MTSALIDFGADPEKVVPQARFAALDVDSLDLVELGQIVEDEYGVRLKGEDLEGLQTVEDAIDLIASRVT